MRTLTTQKCIQIQCIKLFYLQIVEALWVKSQSTNAVKLAGFLKLGQVSRKCLRVLGKLADRAFSRQGKNGKFSRQFYHNWS